MKSETAQDSGGRHGGAGGVVKLSAPPDQAQESSEQTSKAAAEIVERERRQQHAFNRHGLVDPNVNKKMTFGELIDWWRDSYCVRLKSQTILGSIDKHLRPRFGELKLSQIDSSEFEIFLKSMVPEYKPRTPNSLRGVTRRIFNLAIKARKYFGENPMKNVEPLEVNEAVSDYLEFEEVGPFLAGLTGQYRLVCATGLFTAMRLGELYGLSKPDINWKRLEITVRRSWDGETTKARKDLVIPIVPDLVPYLRTAVESSDSMLVFPDPKGEMHTENININERIATALKRAGLIIGYDHVCRTCRTRSRTSSGDVTRCKVCGHKLLVLPVPRPITIHKLRHTTGTLLSKAGVPIQTIQKILGHSDIQVTQKHYQHLNTADQRKAMEKNLVFENLPAPAAEPQFTFWTQSDGSGKDEGRDAPVSRETSRPSKSGRQDLTLQPLGPEGSTRGSDTVGSGPVASDVPEIPASQRRGRSDTDRPRRPGPATSVTFRSHRTIGTCRFLTIREVAERLRVCRATVYPPEFCAQRRPFGGSRLGSPPPTARRRRGSAGRPPRWRVPEPQHERLPHPQALSITVRPFAVRRSWGHYVVRTAETARAPGATSFAAHFAGPRASPSSSYLMSSAIPMTVSRGTAGGGMRSCGWRRLCSSSALTAAFNAPTSAL
jgi:integrase